MVSPIVLWPSTLGSLALVAGLIMRRRELVAAAGIEKLVVAGPVFFAAPLAAFGAEHIVAAQFIQGAVPAWMPAHLFLTYFTGFALEAAALSVVAKRFVRLSASLLALMMLIIIATIHVPNVMAHLDGRIFWTVLVRDTVFATGAILLASLHMPAGQGRRMVAAAGRLWIAVVMLLFAAAYFVFPATAAGVPLEKLTPAWTLAPIAWGYVSALVLLVCGFGLLIPARARMAAIALGGWMTLVTLLLYVPIFAMSFATNKGTAALFEGMNYVFDTLMFGGAILVLAAALPLAGLPSRIASRMREAVSAD